MYRRVPGLRAEKARAAQGMRKSSWTDSTLLDPPQLLDRSTIGEFLKLHAATLMAAGWDREAAIDDGNLRIHTAEELKAELEAGRRRDASDLNPMRIFSERK